MTTINLPFNIKVELFDDNSITSITSNLYKDGHCTKKEQDVIECFILAQAASGIDIEHPDYSTSIVTVMETLANQ